jgi:hypothetical protein
MPTPRLRWNDQTPHAGRSIDVFLPCLPALTTGAATARRMNGGRQTLRETCTRGAWHLPGRHPRRSVHLEPRTRRGCPASLTHQRRFSSIPSADGVKCHHHRPRDAGSEDPAYDKKEGRRKLATSVIGSVTSTTEHARSPPVSRLLHVIREDVAPWTGKEGASDRDEALMFRWMPPAPSKHANEVSNCSTPSLIPLSVTGESAAFHSSARSRGVRRVAGHCLRRAGRCAECRGRRVHRVPHASGLRRRRAAARRVPHRR